MSMLELSHGRTFDPRTGEVRVGTRVTRLEPQPAALLSLLASRPGVLVSHDEIRRHVWADGRHVEFAASLHYAVRQIRRALGDTAPWRDLETMPRRGYRMRREALGCPAAEALTPGALTLEAVTPEAVNGGPATTRLDARPPARTRRRQAASAVAWAVAGGVALAVVALVERGPNDHHAVAVALARAVHDAVF